MKMVACVVWLFAVQGEPAEVGVRESDPVVVVQSLHLVTKFEVEGLSGVKVTGLARDLSLAVDADGRVEGVGDGGEDLRCLFKEFL